MASSNPSQALPPRIVAPSVAQATANASLTFDSPILASWEQAVVLCKTQLTNDDAKIRRLEEAPQGDFFEFRDAAVAAAEKVEAKRFKCTRKVQKVVQTINKYAVVGDIIIQHHAEYTSLVWGAFRFLIMAAAEEHKIAAKLSTALDYILQIMLRTKHYASFYSSYSRIISREIFENLQKSITLLYAQSLNFLIRAVFFFEKKTKRRYVSAAISPFESKFKEILDTITYLDNEIEKDISTIERQARIIQENKTWLGASDYSSVISKLNEEYLDGTCKWFFDRNTYRSLVDLSGSGKKFLLVQGKPGCGKSIIAARVVHHLNIEASGSLLYVFCKLQDDEKNSIESILRSMIAQILQKSPQNPNLQIIVQSYRYNSDAARPSVASLSMLLEHLLAQIKPLITVLDGFDECQESPKERGAFLKTLTDILSKGKHRAILFSRSDAIDMPEFDSWTVINIVSEDVQEDIEKYVTTCLDNSAKLGQHPLRDKIYHYLVDHSNGMILWAKLMISELEHGHRHADRVLQRIPKDLYAVYATILERLKASSTTTQQEQIETLLCLVLVAIRPMKVYELGAAMALYSRPAESLSSEPYDGKEIREIVQLASPLLLEMPDDTVQIAHASLKQYLLNEISTAVHNQEGNLTFSYSEDSLHFRMASILCAYLRSPHLDTMQLTEPLSGKLDMLHEYACTQLVQHLVKSPVASGILDLLRDFLESQFGWRWLHHLENRYNLQWSTLLSLQALLRAYVGSAGRSKEWTELSNVLLYLTKREYDYFERSFSKKEILMSCILRLLDAYKVAGQYGDARRLAIDVLANRNTELGSDESLIWRALFSNPDKGVSQATDKQIQRLILEISEGLADSDETHPLLLQLMHESAEIYVRQSRFHEAETVATKVLESRKKLLGVEHRVTLDSMSLIAKIYSEQGRLDEAEKLQLQVMEALQRLLGAIHPDVIDVQKELGFTWLRQHKSAEVQQLYEELRKSMTCVYGREHYESVALEAAHIFFYLLQNRINDAKVLFNDVMPRIGAIVDDKYDFEHLILQTMAVFCVHQKQFEEAEGLLMKAIELHPNMSKQREVKQLNDLKLLVIVYFAQKKWSKLEATVDKIEKLPNGGQPELLTVGEA